MKILNNTEMMNVEGGAVSASTVSLIVGIVTGVAVFLIGVWDGYLNPNKCSR